MHLIRRVCLFAFALTVPLSCAYPSYGQAQNTSQTIGLGSSQDSSLFTDTGDHWATLCIEGIGTEGLMKGYLDKSFRPDGTMTRTEFAAVMIQAFPDAVKVRESPDFLDVADDFWGKGAIAAAYEKGFLTGYPDNRFKPAQPISRVQAIVVIANAQKLLPSSNSEAILQQFFDDAQAIPSYAESLTAAATERSLIVNYPNVSQLRPNADITRAEATALLCRLNSTGTDARYFVADRYVANFGNNLDSAALPPLTVLHNITSGIYGLLHTHAALDNRLLFFLSDSLWTSDGTVAGTQLVRPLKDIEPGLTPRNPKVIAVSNQRFWMTTDAFIEPNGSTRLFSSDGSADGTIAVATLHPDLPALFARNRDLLTAAETIGDNLLPFIVRGETGSELWITDGKSTAGTQRLAAFDRVERAYNREPIYGEVPVPLTVSGEYVYFQAVRSPTDPAITPTINPDSTLELWRSDGTIEGTVSLGAIAAISPNTTRSSSPNRIYAQVNNYPVTGWALWTSDGTPSSTQLLIEQESMESFFDNQPGLLTTLGDRFFALVNRDSGLELWSTQRDASSTRKVKRLSSDTGSQDNPWFAVEQERLFFSVRGPRISSANIATVPNFSHELWVTEGTAESTQKLADIQVSEEGFTAFRGQWFFNGTSRSGGSELWTTDGTPEGTYQVLDLVPGTNSYYPAFCPTSTPGSNTSDDCPPEIVPRGSQVRSLTVHGDFLYFIADDSDLFRTDGTAQNIQHVQSFVSDTPFRSFPANIVKVNDTLFVMGYGDDKVLLWALPE